MAQNKKVKYVEPDSTYVDTLCGSDLKRYKDKIKIVPVDPYCVPSEDWSEDASLLPTVADEDLVEYLLFRTSYYTMAQYKAVKQLGATNQLTSGWIQGVLCHKPVDSEYVIIKAKVTTFILFFAFIFYIYSTLVLSLMYELIMSTRLHT